MPEVDAILAYHSAVRGPSQAVIENERRQGAVGYVDVGKKPKEVKELMHSHTTQLVNHGVYFNQQVEMDVGMWYGAMVSPGAMGVFEPIRRSFHTLYYGGLIVKTGAGWQTWAQLNWPMAVALSHGGRVMIQLPNARAMPNGDADYFWRWLWGGTAPRGRAAATHGIDRSGNVAEQLVNGRVRRMKEVGGFFAKFKASSGGSHYGLEIALGGAGNLNPYSGRPVVANGACGHFYLYYLRPTENEYGGILIGCETSSPMDRKGAQHKDHYGGSHGIGASNKFSGTGGLKFGGTKLKDPATGKKTQVYWQNAIGSGKGNMIIDLITSDIEVVTEQPLMPPEWVGRVALTPPAVLGA